MKHLFLLRHAKAAHHIPEITDFERPLTVRGRQDAAQIADFIRQKKIVPERIISSPATRTFFTARIIAAGIGYALDEISLEDKIYEAWTEQLLGVIQNINEALDNIMLVGHNPGFQLLTHFLTGYDGKFPTCGLAAITLGANHWHQADKNIGKLLFLKSP